MDISVIIPAHNEEKYIARCIGSVKAAAASFSGQTEIIVVCNRCTDNTRVCFQKHKSKRKLKKYAVRPVKPKGKQGVDVEYNS